MKATGNGSIAGGIVKSKPTILEDRLRTRLQLKDTDLVECACWHSNDHWTMLVRCAQELEESTHAQYVNKFLNHDPNAEDWQAFEDQCVKILQVMRD